MVVRIVLHNKPQISYNLCLDKYQYALYYLDCSHKQLQGNNMRTFRTSYEVELNSGDLCEIAEIEFEIEYSAYVEKEVTYGHPDNWSPGYSDLEIAEIKSLDEIEGFTAAEIEKAASEQYEDAIISDAWDDFNDQINSY